MSTPAEIADALDAAADYIEVHGWCQRQTRDDHGRVCLVGALEAANGLLDANAHLAIVHYLAGPATFWNDAPGRTEFEVIDALRLTAKDVRNEVEA